MIVMIILFVVLDFYFLKVLDLHRTVRESSLLILDVIFIRSYIIIATGFRYLSNKANL